MLGIWRVKSVFDRIKLKLSVTRTDKIRKGRIRAFQPDRLFSVQQNNRRRPTWVTSQTLYLREHLKWDSLHGSINKPSVDIAFSFLIGYAIFFLWFLVLSLGFETCAFSHHVVAEVSPHLFLKKSKLLIRIASCPAAINTFNFDAAAKEFTKCDRRT